MEVDIFRIVVSITPKIADLVRDGDVLSLARDIALEILEGDALLQKPENELLKRQLEKLNRQRQMGWFMIS